VLSRLNLTALLAALAVGDLLFDRVAKGLFLSSDGPVVQALCVAVAFLSYLTGALALFVFASGFVGMLRRRELFPRSMRPVVAVLAMFFLILLAMSVSRFQVSSRLFIQVRTSHAFLAWMIALAVWRSAVPVRARLGMTLFALPSMLHTAALFAGEMGWGRAGLAGGLARSGELFAFLAAGGAPLLLPPAPMRPGRLALVAWMLGLLAVSAVVAGAIVKFDLVQLLALYGLRVDLPSLAATGSWAYLMLFCLAILGTSLLVIPALGADGGHRMLGYGMVMVVTSGYQVASPADLGVAACGLLAMAAGITRYVAPPAGPVAWAPPPAVAAAAQS